MRYSYFTKEEIEAKISKIESCGSVSVDLKAGDPTVYVKFGKDDVFHKYEADEIARLVTSNPKSCAVVDCDEGMMTFDTTEDRDLFDLSH